MPGLNRAWVDVAPRAKTLAKYGIDADSGERVRKAS
jgi:hypothetical protein